MSNIFLADGEGIPYFPLKEAELIDLCKKVVEANFGTKTPDLLADDFKFRFPVVELDKDEFIKAFGSFKLEQAFPDMKTTFYGFRVDPFQPGRVWFDTRSEGTNTGRFGGPFAFIKPTFKTVRTPPQVLSMTFSPEGKLQKFTGGYVVDKNMGNTGGLGGIFGIMYAIGHPLPFPEAQPYVMSWRFWLANRMRFITNTSQELVHAGYSVVKEKATARDWQGLCQQLPVALFSVVKGRMNDV